MAKIKPFKGIRPPKDLVEQVESRPYDVLDSEEARSEAGDNEKSLYHIIKPEIDFPVGTSEYDPRVYEKAVENFKMFQETGWLKQDAEEMYYIYAQTIGESPLGGLRGASGKTQYGLVVAAAVEDYMNGVIKKHELTRRDKEEDRMKHVRVNNANLEPVFFAYPDNAVLDALVARITSTVPEYDIIAPVDGFRHQLWLVKEPEDICTITETFATIPYLYIADGHHRSAAAALVGAEKAKQNPNHRGDEEYNFFMAVCFPASQLTILDYNRVVKDLNGMTDEQFLRPQTLLIMGLGLIAFIVDTAGGVLFAKLLNLFLKNKVNPMIGAAGISAFPMSGRIVHKMGLQEDPQNFLLMHSIGVNVSGQIASVIAGGLILAFAGGFGGFLG